MKSKEKIARQQKFRNERKLTTKKGSQTWFNEYMVVAEFISLVRHLALCVDFGGGRGFFGWNDTKQKRIDSPQRFILIALLVNFHVRKNSSIFIRYLMATAATMVVVLLCIKPAKEDTRPIFVKSKKTYCYSTNSHKQTQKSVSNLLFFLYFHNFQK